MMCTIRTRNDWLEVVKSNSQEFEEYPRAAVSSLILCGKGQIRRLITAYRGAFVEVGESHHGCARRAKEAGKSRLIKKK